MKRKTAKPAAKVSRVIAAPMPTSAKALAEQQIQNIRKRILTAEKNGSTPRELAALENSMSGAIRLYARLSGELEITEASVMRSTHWIKAMKLLREALEKHPEAARAVAKAFEEFGGAG